MYGLPGANVFWYSAHMVLTTRSGNFSSMSPRTKQAIKWLRRIQVGLRVLELNGAIGLLVLMILFTKVDAITGWVLRIAVSSQDERTLPGRLCLLTRCHSPGSS